MLGRVCNAFGFARSKTIGLSSSRIQAGESFQTDWKFLEAGGFMRPHPVPPVRPTMKPSRGPVANFAACFEYFFDEKAMSTPFRRGTSRGLSTGGQWSPPHEVGRDRWCKGGFFACDGPHRPMSGTRSRRPRGFRGWGCPDEVLRVRGKRVWPRPFPLTPPRRHCLSSNSLCHGARGGSELFAVVVFLTKG